MALREYGQRSIRWRLGGAAFGPFDGGLNRRDDLFTEVAPNELYNADNLTLDERGYLLKQNSSPSSASFPAPPGAVISAFYSQILGVAIIQVGTTLYKCALGGVSWTSFSTRTTSAPVQFVDFATGFLVYVHPVDGVRYYNGTTDSAGTAGIKGTCIANWQNKVWIGGDSANPTRLYFSNVGAGGTFSPSDFVDIREKDGKPITALWPASGLLVFKEDSAYRVNDSTTGSFSTIDWQVGCVGPNAIAASDGRIFLWALDGLYAGTGIGPFENIGDKMRPYFVGSARTPAARSTISAVAVNGRVYFAYPRVSQSICDAVMELNPRRGWLMEQYFGGAQVGPFFHYQNAAGTPIASFASGSATIKDLYTGTTRTGYSFSLDTGMIQPFNGRLARVTMLRLTGKLGTGTYSLSVTYITESGILSGWTQTLVVGSNFGETIKVRPMVLGHAFYVSLSDSLAPAAGVTLQSFELDALLTSLR